MLTLHLPWAPSVNRYWGNRVIVPRDRSKKPFVHTFIGQAGTTFRRDVQALVRQKYGFFRPSHAIFQVDLELVAPDRRARDIDNVLKAALDALTHAGIWADDSQVRKLSIEFAEDTDGRILVAPPGHIDVRIWRLTPEPAVQKELSAPAPF